MVNEKEPTDRLAKDKKRLVELLRLAETKGLNRAENEEFSALLDDAPDVEPVPPTVKESIDRMLAEDAGFLPESDYVVEVVLGMDGYEVKGRDT